MSMNRNGKVTRTGIELSAYIDAVSVLKGKLDSLGKWSEDSAGNPNAGWAGRFNTTSMPLLSAAAIVFTAEYIGIEDPELDGSDLDDAEATVEKTALGAHFQFLIEEQKDSGRVHAQMLDNRARAVDSEEAVLARMIKESQDILARKVEVREAAAKAAAAKTAAAKTV